jgi:hypothetical protein
MTLKTFVFRKVYKVKKWKGSIFGIGSVKKCYKVGIPLIKNPITVRFGVYRT